MTSDRDDIHPLLNRLIPAGHCACETSTVFECPSCLSHSQGPLLNTGPSSYWEYNYERDSKDLGLSDDQCNAAFPGLFQDVNLGMKYWDRRGNITQQNLDDIHLVQGVTRAMIFEGSLYVITSKSRGDGEEGM